MRFQPLILTLCVISLYCKTAAEEPVDENTPQTHYLEAGYLKAETWQDRSEFYALLIGMPSPKTLNTMLDGESDEVAVAAAWEQVVRESIQFTGITDGTNIKPEKVDWFLQYVEKRLKLTIPTNWKDSSRNTIIYEYWIQTPSDWTKNVYHLTGKKSFWRSENRLALNGVEIIGEKDGVHIRISDDEVVLEKKVVDSIVKEIGLANRGSGYLTKDRMLVILHNKYFNQNQKVFCFDRTTKKIVWANSAWSEISDSTDNGLKKDRGHFDSWFMHCITWAESNDTIYLFGYWWGGLYIEGFRLVDGKCTFRFYTMPRAHITSTQDDR